ncbi:MAG: GAF domain-containing protein [Actinomycetota bacterium]|nr:GAF domain-containing protein [Actinomycetota bacterium]
MSPGAADAAEARLVLLRCATAVLGDAVTVDDVARAALECAVDIEGMVRAGLAISECAGRALRFVASDGGVLGPGGVRWCEIDGLADVPLARTVRTGAAVLVASSKDLAARYPRLATQESWRAVHRTAALPLVVDDQILGGLLLTYGEEGAFEAGERAFLDAFAALVAQALRRGLAYQVQQANSELLQRSLMRSPCRSSTGWRWARTTSRVGSEPTWEATGTTSSSWRTAQSPWPWATSWERACRRRS